MGGNGTIVNDGTIRSGATSGVTAASIFQGGVVSNLANGLITGYRNGVSITGGAGQISNYGTIVNAGMQSAVYLGAGGVVSNTPTR